MLMSSENLKTDNEAMRQILGDFASEGVRMAKRYDRKLHRLYARNDALEALLREHGIEVPDWPHSDSGGV
jgi:hypothetical protein